MVLYEDKFCRLEKTSLIIKWYYFPTAGSKSIPLNNIQTLFHQRQKICSTRTKSWGMALSPVWWACDMQRHIWHQFHDVALGVSDESTKKGFSVEKLDDFLSALKPLLQPGVEIREDLP